MNFHAKLVAAQSKKQSVLCVGLDPDIERLPIHFYPELSPTERILAFNEAIIESTLPFASSFKLNFAFYERFGTAGWDVLERTRRLIPADIPAIADNKRGDIGNSAKFYAQSVFEVLDFDACTVSPYMGADSIAPFLAYSEKAAFVLARTSNPGGADLQEQKIGEDSLYKILVSQLAKQANSHPGCTALVVGATNGSAMAEIRKLAPDMPFLIPGVGAQGGDAKTVMQATYKGHGSIAVNSSRSILYASAGADFAQKAAEEAKKLMHSLRP
ncbi:MAG: orotidine-5'-phosphate decarboxylase [Rhodothermaceae bacterium]|nr:orotidine-5'-phosphate decarboxylase [Rhodothermaceae bacterium]